MINFSPVEANDVNDGGWLVVLFAEDNGANFNKFGEDHDDLFRVRVSFLNKQHNFYWPVHASKLF